MFLRFGFSSYPFLPFFSCFYFQIPIHFVPLGIIQLELSREYWCLLIDAFQVKQKFHLVYACNYFLFDFWYCLSRQAILILVPIEKSILS